ncbi:MAG: hypothetical protein ACRDQU_05685 [Pseudonocardiaceae bacterium]
MTKPPSTATTGGFRGSPATGRHAQDNPRTGVPAQLLRRRVASWRCEPLPDGRRDPAGPVDEPISEAELASWRAAWWHLAKLDLPAIVPTRVLTAAGRRGGAT